MKNNRNSVCNKWLSLRILSVPAFVFALFALMLSAGCTNDTPSDSDVETAIDPVDDYSGIDLTLVVVGDSEIGAAFARQWSASHESKLNVINLEPEAFADAEYKTDPPADVIIYPAPMIGEIAAARRIEDVPYDTVWNDKELLNNREMLRHSRRTLVTYDKDVVAVPLGSPMLTMIFRQDVLDAIDMKTPQTWEQFDEVVQKLADTQTIQNAAGEDLPTAVEMPLADGSAALMLLARVAPYIRARGQVSVMFNRDNMDPLIDTEPFVRALNELKSTLPHVDATQLKSPADVYRNIVAGRSALAIGWPSVTFETEDALPIMSLKLARVPGSLMYFDSTDGWLERPADDSQFVDVIGFDGLVASLSPDSHNSLAAGELLRWLPAKTNSVKVCPESRRSGPFRASHLGNPVQWTGASISADAAQQFADIIRDSNESTVCLVFPRVPGRREYLAALDQAVLDCLTGQATAESALEAAADRWREITASRNLEKQRTFLKKSEGF